MRIGIVTKWIASGQAIVSRQIRSALEELGHETFVLARPGSGPRASAAQADGEEWRQPGVTEASAHDIPVGEYLRWAEESRLDLVLCDENYQWEGIGALRERGIRTVGRFVWEYFAAEHAEPAKRAYETIYSVHTAERERYRELGIESPLVPWGIHPELLDAAPQRPPKQAGEPVRFWFPGSFLGKRKPIRKVLKAFERAKAPGARLIISAQVPRNAELLESAAAADPRIELSLDDLPEAEHRRQLAGADVLLAPSRWEGLGLPLFEATAFSMPIVTNDRPPMSDLVIDGVSGILVASELQGEARSGIPAWNPDVDALAAAIERLADAGELNRMREGTAEVRLARSWHRTVAALAELVGD